MMPLMCMYLQDSYLEIDTFTGSYQIIMYVLLGIHFFAFIFKLRIYKIEEPKQKVDKDDEFLNAKDQPEPKQADDGTILPSHQIKTISFEEHYKEMRRVFDRSWPWMWLVHSLIVVGCFAAFIVIPGKELVYALYIPLDLLLSFGRAAFFWQNFYLDKLRKEDKKKLKARLAKVAVKRRESEKNQLEANLLDDADKKDKMNESFHTDDSS